MYEALLEVVLLGLSPALLHSFCVEGCYSEVFCVALSVLLPFVLLVATLPMGWYLLGKWLQSAR